MRRFLEDHPELKPLDSTPYKDVLIWANTQRYIELKHFNGKAFYTEHDEEVAIIWAIKCGAVKKTEF